MKECCGKVSSDVPKFPGSPSGGKQTSGATKHGRMKTAGKVEGSKEAPKGMPTIH